MSGFSIFFVNDSGKKNPSILTHDIRSYWKKNQVYLKVNWSFLDKFQSYMLTQSF